jgi:hypothetical protein
MIVDLKFCLIDTSQFPCAYVLLIDLFIFPRIELSSHFAKNTLQHFYGICITGYYTLAIQKSEEKRKEKKRREEEKL